MATGTATTSTPVVEVVKLTKEQATAKFGAVPDGQRYMIRDGSVVIGGDQRPILLAKKKTGSRNKPKKPQFAVPDGKFQSAETKGFDIAVHARLKESDFSDPLHFAEWDVWYYTRKLEQANKNVEELKSLGVTADERRANKDNARILKAAANMLAKVRASGNASAKSALAERLGQLYAEASQG